MTPDVGMRLKLCGLTKEGKKLVEACGVWRVTQIADEVHFSKRGGPWLLLEALTEDEGVRLRSAKWVHGRLDEDFSIVREV